MTLDWTLLAPVSAMVLSARLLWAQVRVGWRGWENALKIVGISTLGYYLVISFLKSSGSLAADLVVSSMLLTVAFISPRVMARLIRARRPNEIEDPELFEDGELKSEDQLRQLGQPKPE